MCDMLSNCYFSELLSMENGKFAMHTQSKLSEECCKPKKGVRAELLATRSLSFGCRISLCKDLKPGPLNIEQNRKKNQRRKL